MIHNSLCNILASELPDVKQTLVRHPISLLEPFLSQEEKDTWKMKAIEEFNSQSD